MEILSDTCNRADWDRWTALAPLEHSWIYGAAAESLGARVLRLRIVEDGQVAGALQLIRRGPVAWNARGVHWRGRELSAAERALRRAIRGVLLLGCATGVRLARGHLEARVPLDRDLEHAMHGKWRAGLRRAERQGLLVLRERGCPGWMARAEAEQRRQRGYRALPASWRVALSRAAPGHLETWGAYSCGEPVAGIVTIRHGNVLTYHAGWTGPAGRQAGAHQLLLARAMEAAQATGARAADLGRIDRDRLPGLARFKLRAGAEAIRCPDLRWVR